MENTLLIDPFIGVRSEIISLGLQQVVGQSLTSISVEIG
jgi:hypothetical protein